MAHEQKIPGPDHPISIEPNDDHIVVRVGNKVVADTTAALALYESSHPVVQYIPRGDIDQEILQHSDTTSYCPYKGDCSYLAVIGADGTATDVAWSYEQPYPAVGSIAGYVAFYADRVDLKVEEKV